MAQREAFVVALRDAVFTVQLSKNLVGDDAMLATLRNIHCFITLTPCYRSVQPTPWPVCSNTWLT
jgi:hypothetical protein